MIKYRKQITALLLVLITAMCLSACNILLFAPDTSNTSEASETPTTTPTETPTTQPTEVPITQPTETSTEPPQTDITPTPQPTETPIDFKFTTRTTDENTVVNVWKYAIENDEVKIYGYEDSISVAVIPEMINGKKVTSIDSFGLCKKQKFMLTV